MGCSIAIASGVFGDKLFDFLNYLAVVLLLDADTIYHWHGFTSYKTGDTGVTVCQTSSTSNVSVIHLESIRDRAAQEPFLVSIGILSGAYSATDIEETTVVHEVGHIFGCQHSDGGIMQSGVEDPALDFSDVSISRIRTSNP